MKGLRNKLTTVLLIIIACSLLLVSCADKKGTDAENDDISVDEQFIKSFEKGLEARWELVEDETETVTAQNWEAYLDAEYTNIGKFANYKFEDKELEYWAKTYISMLDKSRAALKYYDTDRWGEIAEEVYVGRMQAMYEIDKIYPLTVSDEYKSLLMQCLKDGATYSFVYELISNLESGKQAVTKEQSSGKVVYKFVVENTTPRTFESYSITLDVLDKDGVTIDTKTVYCEDWEPGEKMRFEFTVYGDHESIKYKYTSWR